MKILVINGVNLNTLGYREPEIYGNKSYKDLKKYIKRCGKENGVKVSIFQSNYEGKIVEKIQKARNFDGIVINAGAYTHTSIAILDALKCTNVRTVEVHLSDVNNREDFRKNSYISCYAEKVITGKGFSGYMEGIKHLSKKGS